jgi:hypothetical protein
MGLSQQGRLTCFRNPIMDDAVCDLIRARSGAVGRRLFAFGDARNRMNERLRGAHDVRPSSPSGMDGTVVAAGE